MSNVFIDSNLWVYAFIETQKEESWKREVILQLLEDVNKRDSIIVSIQVINEFHWILQRKYLIDENIIKKKVLNGIVKLARIMPIDLDTYKSAFSVRDKINISFWDSLIVASSLKNECSTLYTEDMQDGQVIGNRLKIVNPFEDRKP